MLKRGWICAAALTLLLLPSLVAAGGAGNIKLSRPVAQVARGNAEIYLQALQHDTHPVSDATVTVVGQGPNGQTFTASGQLDNAFGTDNVYKVTVPFEQAGDWKLTITAKSSIYFPPLTVPVQVVAAGTKLPDPGPVQPFRQGAADGHAHSHAPAQTTGSSAATAPPAVAQTQTAAAASAPAPAVQDRTLWWAAAAVVAAGLGGAGFLLWRRRLQGA